MSGSESESLPAPPPEPPQKERALRPAARKSPAPLRRTAFNPAMVYIPAALLVGATALILRPGQSSIARAANVPDQAQVISPKSFAVLDKVTANLTSQFVWPGTTSDELKAKPFHIYDDEFYAIIGDNPTLTLIAETDGDPLFHEAAAWFPPTDELFFVQNAGDKAAGTGLNKSAVTQKISLSQAAAIASSGQNGTSYVNVTVVDANPSIINPNGATNYKNGLVFTGEGQGDDVAPAIYYLNPEPPYNVTVLLNNYFGRQFNSLNDVAINPRNKEIYFTDTTYGYLQDFRPSPGLPDQIYRFNEKTGLVSLVTDAHIHPNGLTFSPDGKYAYVADTGAGYGFYGFNATQPATIYRYDVEEDGTFGNRKSFAYASPRLPDGIHTDSNGNVYTGAGDGVQVFNPSGKLIGKIYLGTTSANFQFAGDGRMVILAETKLYYATLAASGAPITNYDYSSVS